MLFMGKGFLREEMHRLWGGGREQVESGPEGPKGQAEFVLWEPVSGQPLLWVLMVLCRCWVFETRLSPYICVC